MCFERYGNLFVILGFPLQFALKYCGMLYLILEVVEFDAAQPKSILFSYLFFGDYCCAVVEDELEYIQQVLYGLLVLVSST